jgi:hypothetical protein
MLASPLLPHHLQMISSYCSLLPSISLLMPSHPQLGFNSVLLLLGIEAQYHQMDWSLLWLSQFWGYDHTLVYLILYQSTIHLS